VIICPRSLRSSHYGTLGAALMNAEYDATVSPGRCCALVESIKISSPKLPVCRKYSGHKECWNIGREAESQFLYLKKLESFAI
jgi:hypothetical protein